MGNIAALGNTVVQTTPVGVIEAFAGVNAPAGWLFCDGSAVSRIQYPELFSALSTTYGSGDGSTTFNLPDMRGRMPVGKGSHSDVATLGNNEGASLANRRPKHQHTVYDPSHNHSQNSHGHTFDRGEWVAAGAAGNQTGVWGATKYTTQNTSSVTASNIANSTGIKINPEGASSSTSPQDAPPYLVVNYIIKAVADLPRGGWFYQNQPPVVTQLPSNPQIGEQVYLYSSSPSAGYRYQRYNGSAWDTFSDSRFVPDTSGRVLNPNQPAFQALNPNGQFITGITEAAFNTTLLNVGSCYNTSNGRFTAPIAGRYFFSFDGLFDNTTTHHISMRKNGVQFDGSEGYTQGNEQWISKTMIWSLNVGDYISIYIDTATSRIHQRYGSFCGYLLS